MKFVFVFLILFCWGISLQAQEVVIHTEKGPIIFNVAVADTPELAEKGLMFRSQLNENEGMLFVDDTDRIWHMWMKNTFIPLDMIFVTRDGYIVKIIANAQPHDLTLLSSDQPVGGVLEIGGGLCAKKGIAVGDKVISDHL